MPTYEFIAEDGSIIEEFYPITSCPKTVKRKGKKYKRVAFSPGNKTVFNAEQVATTVGGYPRIDYTLPKGDLGGGTTPDGRPIIKSQQHEQEIIRQSDGRMRRE